MNKEFEIYFKEIEDKVNLAYNVARDARKKGLDPIEDVEIPLAKNMAERVEGLISVVAPQIKNSGVVERIYELEKEYSKLDWRVALKISEEVAKETFCKFKDKIEAMEVGIRVGIAYVTNGVVASPLEGFTNLKIRKRRDGKEYVALFFSGPIRSAGGTGASVSVIIGDYVRKKMGYSAYDPSEQEIKRIFIEMTDYHERINNLQYFPSEQESDFMIKHLEVQIDGDPSEKLDVSNYKDLERIETNKLRNGVCLVIGEGLTQKAPKLWRALGKWGNDFDLKHWNFLDEFLKIQKRVKSKEKDKEESNIKIRPDFTFIKDIVAGRPVLTYPLRTGGFRLRYGRCRNSGLSSMCISPVTMRVLDNYIAIGTQLKVERPGKGTALSSCDSIEGPIVKLKNHDVVFLENEDEALKINDEIEEILFLGDILVNYGDFFNRAHLLVPCGYCEEWWLREVEEKFEKKFEKDIEKLSNYLNINKDFLNKLLNDFTTKINFEDALNISLKLEIPLHPRWTYHWNDINKDMFLSLLYWFRYVIVKQNKAILPLAYDIDKDLKERDPKRVLELIGLPHKVINNENVVIEDDDSKAFLYVLSNVKNLDLNEKDVLDILNNNLEIKLRDKSGTFIGARMGRPEKAKMRKMTGSPHILFPVGEEGGKLRSFQSALEKGKIKGDFPIFYCEKCSRNTIYHRCEICNNKSTKGYYCNKCDKTYSEEMCEKHGALRMFKKDEIDIKEYFSNALKNLKLKNYPELIKGVRGTSNEDHTVENLGKGILRAIHNVYVNKDGTIRYDMTELCLTAFKPKEIGTNIEKLKQMGYERDIYGNDLENDEQILELKPQDVVLPGCDGSDEEGADIVMFKIANFIDDLLNNFYKEKRFYNLKNKEDIVGHLIIGLAPHISAGTIARIIGFSKTQGFYAHPLFHCAVRRDADGDEIAIILLMDALLNFSRKYLPAHRGARQDTPLVITPFLIPSEVDDMVFDMDIVDKYPLEFYNMCLEYKEPWGIKIEQVKSKLGKDDEYYGYKFTHHISNINKGVRVSAYKSIPTMEEKVLGQIKLAEKIRAVDENDVARLIIDRHFLRDIRGNLRKFSQQQFRCVNCNEKYRRPPLIGTCLKCGGKIIFTISEGSIIKYLEPSVSLAEKFEVSPYLRQSLELTKMMIESVFGKDKEKQEGLGKWFG
ncbi:MAG: DNA polymerase II large subunit [archaeon]